MGFHWSVNLVYYGVLWIQRQRQVLILLPTKGLRLVLYKHGLGNSDITISVDIACLFLLLLILDFFSQHENQLLIVQNLCHGVLLFTFYIWKIWIAMPPNNNWLIFIEELSVKSNILVFLLLISLHMIVLWYKYFISSSLCMRKLGLRDLFPKSDTQWMFALILQMWFFVT